MGETLIGTLQRRHFNMFNQKNVLITISLGFCTRLLYNILYMTNEMIQLQIYMPSMVKYTILKHLTFMHLNFFHSYMYIVRVYDISPLGHLPPLKICMWGHFPRKHIMRWTYATRKNVNGWAFKVPLLKVSSNKVWSFLTLSGLQQIPWEKSVFIKDVFGQNKGF